MLYTNAARTRHVPEHDSDDVDSKAVLHATIMQGVGRRGEGLIFLTPEGPAPETPSSVPFQASTIQEQGKH